MLGGIVDGGAGGDDTQRHELGHQLFALLLEPVQQVEAVGAQRAVVGVGFVQDQDARLEINRRTLYWVFCTSRRSCRKGRLP